MTDLTLSRRPKLLEPGHPDNFRTPGDVVWPLLRYLPPGLIWEPSCGKGNLVRALLMPVTVFDSDDRRRLMARHHAQFFMPKGRICFETPNHDARVREGKRSSSWFYSIWVC